MLGKAGAVVPATLGMQWVRVNAATGVNPGPAADTLVPGCTLTLNAAPVARYVLVMGSVNNDGHQMRLSVYRDGALEYPQGGGNIWSESTDNDPRYTSVLDGLAVLIPGDNATHTLELRWSSGNAGAFTVYDRCLSVIDPYATQAPLTTMRQTRNGNNQVIGSAPTSDSDIPNMGITVPASGVARTVLVSCAVLFSGSHGMRARLYLDGGVNWPASLGQHGTFGNTFNENHVAGIPVAIPGDGATHSVHFAWQAQSSTAGITVNDVAVSILDSI